MSGGGRPSRSSAGAVATRPTVARGTGTAAEPTVAAGAGCSRYTCAATVSAGTTGEAVTTEVHPGSTTCSTGATVAGSTTVAIGAGGANALG